MFKKNLVIFRAQKIKMAKSIFSQYVEVGRLFFYTQYITGNHICQSHLHLILVEVHPYKHTYSDPNIWVSELQDLPTAQSV